MTEQLSPSTVAPSMRMTSTYTDLARTVRESGLLARCYGYYWSRGGLWLAMLGVVITGMVRLGDSWLQLVLAAVLGGVLTQFGFLGHDAAHRQVFASARWNDWTARILSGGVSGLSYGWWRGKHNLHHAAPNQVGRDPDIGPGVVAYTAELAQARRGLARWFTHRQGWLLLPMLTMEGANLHVAGVRTLLGSKIPHRGVELLLIAARTAGYLFLLLELMSPGKAAAFVGVQLAVFGVLLGGAFAPNHIGMPIVPRGAKVDFLRRQVLMSRNVKGNFLVDAAMGGLNYQVEHHLFPSMARPQLKKVRLLVRDHCRSLDIPYTEVGLLTALASVVDHLNNVGIRASAPFDCPLASQLRG